MERSVLIGLLVAAVLLAGCQSAFERRLKSTGCDRYAIAAQATTFKTAEVNFTEKADRLCPKGYKILERHYDSGELKVKVECVCQAESGTEKTP
jgi:hypothetical protein